VQERREYVPKRNPWLLRPTDRLVAPAKAGSTIYCELDSGFRRNDALSGSTI
jgi:hypothetical protein